MLLTHKIVQPTTQIQKSMMPTMPARPTMPPVVQLDENMLRNAGIEFVTSGMHLYYCWMTKLMFLCHVHWQDLSNYMPGVSVPRHGYTWEPTCTSAPSWSTPAIVIYPCMVPFKPSLPQPADTLTSYFNIALKPRRRQACPEWSLSMHLGVYHNVVHWVHCFVHLSASDKELTTATTTEPLWSGVSSMNTNSWGKNMFADLGWYDTIVVATQGPMDDVFCGWGMWNCSLVHADIVGDLFLLSQPAEIGMTLNQCSNQC